MPRGDLRDLERRVRRLERMVDQMSKADQIAKGVAAELAKRNQANGLSLPQKLGAALAAAIVVADALRGLVS